MKHNTKRILSLLLSLVLAVSLITPAMGAEDEETAPVQEYIKTLLESSGLTEEQLGDYPADYNALAESLGMIEDKDDQDALNAPITADQMDKMDAIALELYNALHNEDGSLKASGELEPLFVNGLAQPIFPYTSGCVSNVDNSQYSEAGGQPASEEVYDNASSDIIRYMVYVETNYDTDGDGKLDLVKALVQVPRAAAEGTYKAATIFEARPYITGCTPLYGDEAGYGEGGYDVSSLYSQPAPRTPAGEAVGTMEAAKDADSNDWYYWNTYEDMYDYEDLTWYDYFLVRGFAVVESGGIGTRDSEGFETCGTDLEIDSFKCIIEWLNGDRVAYTDKTSNIPVVADWSAGSVGTTGRSYAGTTQFGLATTGVEGLKTVVPVAGIASWYEYTNSQGINTRRGANYVDVLAMYCAGRYLDEEDWNQLFPTYGNYLNQLRQEQNANVGDYFKDLWSCRDYTLNADKIQIPALIVHGLNDDNVRTKESDLMYKAFTQAGQDVKFIFHQDGHLTPAYPAGELEFEVGGRMYDEILNQWFSHYLYGVDNGAEDLPAVLAQSNYDTDVWNTYDSWEAAENLILTGSADQDVTITSDCATFGATRSNWRDIYSSDSTPSSAMFVADVAQDAVVKGSVAVSFSATVANVAADDALRMSTVTSTAAAPRGAVDHDNFVDPANLDTEDAALMADGDLPISERNNLMVCAMLVDLNDEAFPTCNTSGSYVPKTTIAEDGVWMGGGVKKFDFVKLNNTDVTYKVIARGWMDLCNPGAGYDSASASTKVALQEGQSYDYTIYLQPNLYTVPAGHQLAVVVYASEPGMLSYTQHYAVTLDKDSVVATVPVDSGAAQLQAVYQDNSVYLTVATDRNGKVTQSVPNGPVEPGTEVTLTAQPNEGFEFTGWTVNGESAGTDATLTLTIDKDTGVTPSFKKIPEQVTFTVKETQNGTVTQSVENGQVAAGTEVTLTAAAASGYQFSGWTVNGVSSGTDATLKLTIKENTEVAASFTAQSSGGGGGGGSRGSSTPTYTVTAQKADNGAISVSPARAASGVTVNVTLTPADGYQVDSFSVTDANGKEVSVTDKGNNTCSFTMPAANVTVAATFKAAGEEPVEPEGLPFTDVADSAWYRSDVAAVYEAGLMTGTSATTFAPDQDTSRAMIVTILYRLEKEPAVTGGNTFTDVAEGAWYTDAVTWAQDSGIVTGYTETTFGPNDPITREQLATILYRYAQAKGVDVSVGEDTNILSYNDISDLGQWAMSAMQWACGAGLISGDNNGNLLPKNTAARSQVAAVLHRAADALKLTAE